MAPSIEVFIKRGERYLQENNEKELRTSFSKSLRTLRNNHVLYLNGIQSIKEMTTIFKEGVFSSFNLGYEENKEIFTVLKHLEVKKQEKPVCILEMKSEDDYLNRFLKKHQEVLEKDMYCQKKCKVVEFDDSFDPEIAIEEYIKDKKEEELFVFYIDNKDQNNTYLLMELDVASECKGLLNDIDNTEI